MYAPNDVMLASDPKGQTLLDMIYGQRLVSDDLSARARSQAGLIKDLQSRGVLDQMQWHREPGHGNYPIHIAVQKAVHTQQTDPVKVLLNNDPRPAHVDGPWISQLQLVDGEGDTPLHVAIKVHALAGTDCLLLNACWKRILKLPCRDLKIPCMPLTVPDKLYLIWRRRYVSPIRCGESLSGRNCSARRHIIASNY